MNNSLNKMTSYLCEVEEYCAVPDDSFATRAIRAGQDPDQWKSHIVIPPIHTGTTFKQNGPEKGEGEYFYGRCGNPTRSVLESCIASLDMAKYCVTFSSGLGNTTGVCALLKSGDHVICGEDVYIGTVSYFTNIAKNQGLEVDFIDTTVADRVRNTIKPNTKMVWIESPTNPLLKIMDIQLITKAIKSKSKDVILVVDNTFLTPYFQKPLLMGADIAVYSLTKYMNGHTDVIMGAITTNNEHLYKSLSFIQESMGITPSPFDCYLVNRGLKTLSIRLDRHTQSASRVAKFLEQHPQVEKVLYPGLESHPQYKLAKRLWTGTSGMISMYIKGDVETSKKFLEALKIFTLAISLGGFESLVQFPALMTYANVPETVRKSLGIEDTLIRLSIGLESASDLINDLDHALWATKSS